MPDEEFRTGFCLGRWMFQLIGALPWRAVIAGFAAGEHFPLAGALPPSIAGRQPFRRSVSIKWEELLGSKAGLSLRSDFARRRLPHAVLPLACMVPAPGSWNCNVCTVLDGTVPERCRMSCSEAAHRTETNRGFAPTPKAARTSLSIIVRGYAASQGRVRRLLGLDRLAPSL